MNDLLEEKINKFEILREQSIFCKISLGNSRIDWGRCCSQDCYPYAFTLYEDCNLGKIDNLINKFKIQEKVSKDFKKRLEDKILDKQTVDLNSYNSMESALIELLVADFLSIDERILDLAAWKHNGMEDSRPDIKSQNMASGTTYSTEIKYLGQIPELYNHFINQVMNNVPVSGCWLPDISTLYTYLNMRMVDAIIQLNNLSLTNNEKKRCFILLRSQITSNKNIIQAVRDKENWCRNKLTFLCGKLGLPEDKYLKKDISNWQKETDCLVIAYLNTSYAIDEKLNSQSILKSS